jgi:ribosomal protein S6--L-glutamate ligase
LNIGVAGIDMLESAEGTKVIEVNASPGFEGLEPATGVNVAKAIIDYAVKLAESRD